MWLWTTDQPSQILNNGTILEYADFVEGQYVFRLKVILELPAIPNLADTKKEAKPGDIELCHSCMRYLGHESVKSLQDLSSGINLKETASKKLCGDNQKENQTCQLSKNYIFQCIIFLGWVHSNLERSFPQNR